MSSVCMRAAVYRGVNEVRVETVPVPELQEGEVLVRIAACGVCGTDLKKIRHGLVPPPRIFGHEMAGTVAAVGPGVTAWRGGDRVAPTHHVPCLECHFCRRRAFAQCPTYKRTGTTAGFEPAGGGFAEYIRVMDWIALRGMVRVPDEVHFEEATFVEPVNTCLKAVLKADVQPGDTVLVVGQGQIGLLFTQLCRWRGAAVLASDFLPFRREAACRSGAAEAFDPATADLPAEVKARTGGRGADLAVLAVPSEAAVGPAFESVRPGGRVLLFAHTHLGDPLTVDGGAVCMLEKDLVGSYSSDITLQEQAADLVFRRVLNVRDLITHRFLLEEVGEAIRMADAPRHNSLKIMVTP